LFNQAEPEIETYSGPTVDSSGNNIDVTTAYSDAGVARRKLANA